MVWSQGKCSRLDRALISPEWMSQAQWELKGLGRKSLDHSAIWLIRKSVDWGPKPFKVFNIWLENEEFKGAVKNYWEDNL